MQETFSILVDILQDRFDISSPMKPETTIEEIGLDSLDVINLLFVIEEMMKVKVPEEGFEEESIETLGQLAEYIDAQKA